VINPNNHALDGAATSRWRKKAVAEIAGMFGWKNFLGAPVWRRNNGQSGGLWWREQTQPGRKILASEQAHYTHQRISAVLQLPLETVACDSRAACM